MKNRNSNFSRVILFVSSLLLVCVLFVPLWRIDLDAPQYPEGLRLLLYPHKLGGDVDIINGLNHYIGMKTLHTEDFIEFKVLPYLIGFFALLFLVSGIINTRKWLWISVISFVIFGIVSMIDFYRWEYDYGHNLDPNAAIKVPGMAYQPPLIGFKQLLNFGAYSIPSTGGWLFVGAGVLLVLALVKEKYMKKIMKNILFVIICLAFVTGFNSCSTDGPEPILLNKDMCDNCRMNISDARFGAEVQTQKGRYYKFDDLKCLAHYAVEQPNGPIKSFYIHDFSQNNVLIEATKAYYVWSKEFSSPMRGNTAAFANRADAEKVAQQYGSAVDDWETAKKRILE